MPSDLKAVTRFRSRKDAERVVDEIVGDGGEATDYRIQEGEDGTCVILILDGPKNDVAGVLGA